MSHSCPMSFENIDSNVSRLTSVFVSLCVVGFLLTNNIVFLLFLFADFSLRIFCNKELSPLFRVSKFLKKSFKLKDAPVDGGAKQLASYFGLFFVLLLIIAYGLNWFTFMYIVAIIFLVCSLLDALANYCLGCKIYYIIKKIYPGFMS